MNQPMDTTLQRPIELPELYLDPNQAKADALTKQQFDRLQRRVYKVYPYAKTTAATLVALNEGMAKMKTSREKKKYFKIVEDYLNNTFEEQLKKLSTKDGQILIKLIYRQTGETTFDLIKEYKSGWKAFWSNNTAKIFNLNLKAKYTPMDVHEDYWIETILYRAFENGRLVKQDAVYKVDYDAMSNFWVDKLSKAKKQAAQ
ncbi:DUF4294 domain-containing protein [Flavobacterium sp. 3HN19-14]|uniref:DUF4294 domain-containing protein n=1 Tax=Flavobacterium sp. 3HN19-14 TaxID=3448133 RepID=UPI003EE283B6